MTVIRMAVLCAAACVVAGCEANPNQPAQPEAVFEVSACSGQTFKMKLTDPQLIQQARNLIGQSEQPIVNGRLARGDGGFNQPYDWHLVPESVEFADLTVEVCDGCPQMVQDDLDYWIETVGRFCPWTSRVVRRVRLP